MLRFARVTAKHQCSRLLEHFLPLVRPRAIAGARPPSSRPARAAATAAASPPSSAAADDDAAAPRGGGEGGGGGDGDEEEEAGAAEEEPDDEEEAEEYDSDEDAVRARVLVNCLATSRRDSVTRVLVLRRGRGSSRRDANHHPRRTHRPFDHRRTVTRRHRCSRSTNRRCGSRRVPMSCECSRSCRKTRRSARCDGMECAVKYQRRSPRSAAGGRTRRRLLAIRHGPECATQCSVT